MVIISVGCRYDSTYFSQCVCVWDWTFLLCLSIEFILSYMSFCRRFLLLFFFLFKNLFKWFAWFCSLYQVKFTWKIAIFQTNKHIHMIGTYMHEKTIMKWMLYLNANALHTKYEKRIEQNLSLYHLGNSIKFHKCMRTKEEKKIVSIWEKELW